MGDLLEECPQCVLDRYIAVTSFDSGPLYLNDIENANGWESRNGVTYSPRIHTIEGLPYDNCFDEWYVFDEAPDLGRLCDRGTNIFDSEQTPGCVYDFVNFGFGFSLHLPDRDALTELFWKQLGWIQPTAYIADGNQLTWVSRDKQMMDVFKEVLRRDDPAKGRS
jgi:hypothetical protein